MSDDTIGGTPRQFGKYRIIAHLATGGMAEIYLAAQTSLAGFEKLVVIKRILPHLAQEERFIEMFLDEARIAAVLNHPNVVQIFDLGRINDQYFIAMEYLAGESLSLVVKRCRQRGEAVAPELAAGILLQAAEGLHHAHVMKGKDGKPLGIVHRDVSPQNIFVLYDGGVKVVDFGIARAAFRTTHTRTGTLKGKYSYMSPEQILGEELDNRSDVFSLGIVLWETLTGRKLFRHESDLKLLQSITDEDAPSPQTVNPGVPAALAEISRRALARNRAERYQSAHELRQALAGYLKTATEEADTTAISKFMRATFSERMAEKQRLIEGAQSADYQMSDYLFGDINQYQSDTEHSIPRSTPGPFVNQRDLLGRGRRRSAWRLLGPLLAVVLLAGIGIGVWTLTRGPSGESLQSDAGLVLPPSLDAGPFRPEPAPDAGGASPEAAPAPDAGTQAITPADAGTRGADPGKRPGGKPHGGKTPGGKTAGGKNPKEKDPQAKVTPPPVGPPGRLRLTTSPWTEIYYNGKKLGQTPLVDVELPPGRIRLKAVNKDMGIEQEILVEIKSGERTTQRFNF